SRALPALHELADEREHVYPLGRTAHRFGARGEDLRQSTILALDSRGVAHEGIERAPRVVVRERRARELREALEARRSERLDEVVLRREVPVDGADSHARGARDLLDLRVDARARHAHARRLEHALAVAPRVRALWALGCVRGRGR